MYDPACKNMHSCFPKRLYSIKAHTGQRHLPGCVVQIFVRMTSFTQCCYGYILHVKVNNVRRLTSSLCTNYYIMANTAYYTSHHTNYYIMANTAYYTSHHTNYYIMTNTAYYTSHHTNYYIISNTFTTPRYHTNYCIIPSTFTTPRYHTNYCITSNTFTTPRYPFESLHYNKGCLLSPRYRSNYIL